MRYLREHVQPEVAAGAALTGSSAGALACILAACGERRRRPRALQKQFYRFPWMFRRRLA
jgi:hypothetical protein